MRVRNDYLDAYYPGIILLLTVLIGGCGTSKFTGENKPEYAKIQVEHLLGQNIDAIVRDYSTTFEIEAIDKATVTHKRTVTILNKNALNQGRLIIGYDKFRTVNFIEGQLYDASGNFVRTLSSGDTRDFSAISSYSLYEDNRVRTAELYYNEFPYTISFTYQIVLNSLLNLPDWVPQTSNVYVDSAQFKLITSADHVIRYKAKNIEEVPGKKLVDGDSVFTWILNDLPAEEFNEYEKIPRLLFASDTFVVEGYEGSTDNWENFGRWYYNLSEGRQVLPAEEEKAVQSIVNSTQDRIERIRKLYEYMQSRTRYVSVQLGIGGWRPFPADYVTEKGYGDCKALTNYMLTLLKYAGIEAYPVLIRNGISAPSIEKDFPSNQFNHVVLFVPGEDTVWLESTSQSVPFNFIGSGNANRRALLVKENDSRLIKTPTFDHTINQQKNELEITLDENGEANITVNRNVSGYYLDRAISSLANKSDAQREEWLHEILSLNTFKIGKKDFSEIDYKKNNPTIRYEIISEDYATNTGSRLFIPVNKLNRWTVRMSSTADDETDDINLPFGFRELDKTELTIPEGFQLEALPEGTRFETEFGTYSLEFATLSGGKVIIERKLEIREPTITGEQSNALQKLFDTSVKSDNLNIVLRRK